MATVQVSQKGQIVIPPKIRKELNIKPKTRLEIYKEGDRIIGYPIPDDPIEACFGAIRLDKSATEIIKEIRKEEKTQEKRKARKFL